jgi:hypothetical protein|tara:strand:+ start:313 stop:1554 length:1242 start_codon:yes stop_codon:yes gene_type:complete
MAVQSKEENKLIAGLPADYEVVQADDQFWLLAFLEVPTGESFTWRYLIEDPLEILEKIPGNITLTPNTVVSNGEVVESAGQVTTDMWNNSFNFGTVNQLYAITNKMEEGATSYDYLVETIKEEAKTAPWLLSTDENGNYDYLAVALEAAQEGRTPRDAELMNTTWYRTHDANQRAAVKLKAQDPATYQTNYDATYDQIVGDLMMNGVQTIDPNLVTTLATNSIMGTPGYSDLQKIYDKLTNDRLPYSLPDEVAAVIEGKPLNVIQATSAVANDIDSILGPGASANADLESIANEREANPYWYAETYIPSLEEAFAAKYPQYKDTNVNKYSTAAPQWRYEWKNLVGQDPDEQSSVWTQFISTNDIKEREDIAFKYAAELGTQTYQDKAVADLEGVFGQPGQRVTGGTMWNSRVK